MLKNQKLALILRIWVGALFLAILSQFTIPLEIPVTLQSLGVSLIAIVFNPLQAVVVIGLYLGSATFGLHVLAGGASNPQWFMGKTGGYLLSFIPAAFLMSYWLEKEKSQFVKSWTVFCGGTLLILVGGTLWLANFVGLEKAIQIGFTPFLFGSLIKITLASCIYKGVKR